MSTTSLYFGGSKTKNQIISPNFSTHCACLMMNELVSSTMTKNVITLTPEDTLDKVRDILLSKHIHHLPILEGRKLVGFGFSPLLWSGECGFSLAVIITIVILPSQAS